MAIDVAIPGGAVWIVAPTYKLTQPICREISRTIAPFKDHVVRYSRYPLYVEFQNGGYIEAKSSDDPRALQGSSLDLIVFDEAATENNPDIWFQYLRPMLTDREGRAVFPTTPKGMNWIYDLWQLGCDPHESEYAAFSHPTTDNPYLPPSEIEEARRQMPERVFRQEYLAEFIPDADSVFRLSDRNLGALQQYQPTGGHMYAIGVDLARSKDYTVISVIDCALKQLVWIDRFANVEWDIQRARILETYRMWHGPVCIDSTGMGQPIVEELQQWGIPIEPVHFTLATKSALISDLSTSLEQGDLKILNEDWLVNELRSYQYERTSSGALRMNAPQGKHDDGVISLALAWHAAIPYIGQFTPRVPKEELMRPAMPVRLQIPKSIARR